MNSLFSAIIFISGGLYLFFLAKKTNIKFHALSKEIIPHDEFKRKYNKLKWKYFANLFIGLFILLILFLSLVFIGGHGTG